MININIETGAAKHLMIGTIVLVTGLCFFAVVGDPDLLDALRNRIFPDSEYFKHHREHPNYVNPKEAADGRA